MATAKTPTGAIIGALVTLAAPTALLAQETESRPPAPAVETAAPETPSADAAAGAPPAGATPDVETPAPADEGASEAAQPATERAATEAPAEAVAAESGKLPLVAVLDLRHAEGDGPIANALATMVTAEVSARPEMRAVSRNELQAVVAHQAEQALMGCESAKCASDIAKLVEADLVVTGGIERVEEAYVFSLTLFDPATGAMRKRVEATWRSDPDEIVLLVRPYVDRLFGGAEAASWVGHLEILAPEGATVFLDGKEIGSAPIGAPVENLAIGVHQLEITKAGFVTAAQDVVISRAETTIARVELEEEPYYTQWWFWTAVGGGAAVAVAAGATIGTVAIIAAAEPPPTTVIVKSGIPAGLR
jgi:hypothetical protein